MTSILNLNEDAIDSLSARVDKQKAEIKAKDALLSRWLGAYNRLGNHNLNSAEILKLRDETKEALNES